MMWQSVLEWLLFLVVTASSIPSKPNILFLMTDSMDGRLLDPHAPQYPIASMPTLKYLASEGVNFIRSYSNSPECVPSRCSMMTGRYTHKQGCYNNNVGFAMGPDGKLDDNCLKWYGMDGQNGTELCKYLGTQLQNNTGTMINFLNNSGYEVYMYGKVDIGGTINQHWPHTNADGFHHAPETKVITRSAGINNAIENNPSSPEMLNLTDNNFRDGDLTFITNCSNKLQELADSGSDTPWFLYCSLHLPHPPFYVNSTWLAGVNDTLVSNISRPEGWMPVDEMHPYDQFQTYQKNVDGDFSTTNITDVIRAYYALNVQTDHLFSLLWNRTLNAGFNLDNTIVMYVSDHGEMAMEHRQIWKETMYEGSSRVPMFIAGPGIEKNKTVTNITQLLDVVPTLLDLAGGDIPDFLDGQSLVRFLNETDYNKTNENETEFEDYIFSEFHSCLGNTGSFMIRRGDYKYIQFGHFISIFYPFDSYIPMLFDVENDPYEVMNLYEYYYDSDQPVTIYFNETDRYVTVDITQLVDEMEALLVGKLNYEYYDCRFKQNDFKLFDQYKYEGETKYQVYNEMTAEYGFLAIDWDDAAWNRTLLWIKQLKQLGKGDISWCDCILTYPNFSESCPSFGSNTSIPVYPLTMLPTRIPSGIPTNVPTEEPTLSLTLPELDDDVSGSLAVVGIGYVWLVMAALSVAGVMVQVQDG